MRFPQNAAALSLADRLIRQHSQLVRNLQDDFDDLLQEQYRAGYTDGFRDGANSKASD